MHKDDDLTGGLDLLGDWLDAKGYGEEAGLCTRVMDHMHKQDKRIAAFEAANLELRKEADMMHSEYKAAAARIAALEAENAKLKAKLWQATGELENASKVVNYRGDYPDI